MGKRRASLVSRGVARECLAESHVPVGAPAVPYFGFPRAVVAAEVAHMVAAAVFEQEDG